MKNPTQYKKNIAYRCVRVRKENIKNKYAAIRLNFPKFPSKMVHMTIHQSATVMRGSPAHSPIEPLHRNVMVIFNKKTTAGDS